MGGYLRHAEIKHGRVAMAGFLGFCAGCTDVVKGPHSVLPYRGYVENVSPQEQWDNIPLYGKLQILVFVGMLESYGEGAGMDESEYVHYTKGGLPGFYPSIKGKGLGQISLDLYDPFGILPEQTEEEKERGRRVEINNGRAAMLGLFAVLSESKGLIVPRHDSVLQRLLHHQLSDFVNWLQHGAYRCGETMNRLGDWPGPLSWTSGLVVVVVWGTY